MREPETSSSPGKGRLPPVVAESRSAARVSGDHAGSGQREVRHHGAVCRAGSDERHQEGGFQLCSVAGVPARLQVRSMAQSASFVATTKQSDILACAPRLSITPRRISMSGAQLGYVVARHPDHDMTFDKEIIDSMARVSLQEPAGAAANEARRCWSSAPRCRGRSGLQDHWCRGRKKGSALRVRDAGLVSQEHRRGMKEAPSLKAAGVTSTSFCSLNTRMR